MSTHFIEQNASSASVAISTLVAQVTSEPEKLEAVDISVSISIIDQLTEEAVTNPQVPALNQLDLHNTM